MNGSPLPTSPKAPMAFCANVHWPFWYPVYVRFQMSAALAFKSHAWAHWPPHVCRISYRCALGLWWPVYWLAHCPVQWFPSFFKDSTHKISKLKALLHFLITTKKPPQLRHTSQSPFKGHYPLLNVTLFYTLTVISTFLLFQNFKKPKTIRNPFAVIDYIVVKKQARILEIYHQGKCLKSYKISLGFSPTGQKEREGDGKTPEGLYTICFKNPKSKYHLSLKIDYPHEHHVASATAKGLSAGSDIMIHGQPKSISWSRLGIQQDWTHGCIAVKNDEIEEIYSATSVGTPIDIRP